MSKPKTASKKAALRAESVGKGPIWQTINQKKSFELVCVFVHTLVAQVVAFRNILPPLCIAAKIYDALDTDCSLNNLINSDPDEIDLFGNKRQRSKPKLVVLLQGVHSSCDKLLFWLKGVTDAISKGYLDQMQLRMFHNDNVSENIIELYSLSFTYLSGNISIDISLESNLQESRVHIESIQAVKESIGDLLYRLYHNILDFRTLPDTTKVDMNLAYNASAPRNYHAPGFLPSTPHRKVLNRLLHVGSVNTGLHSVALGIAARPPLRAEAMFITDTIESVSTPLRTLNLRAKKIQLADSAQSILSPSPISKSSAAKIDSVETGSLIKTGSDQQSPEGINNSPRKSSLALGDDETQEPREAHIQRLHRLRPEDVDTQPLSDPSQPPKTSSETLGHAFVDIAIPQAEREQSIDDSSTQGEPSSLGDDTPRFPKRKFISQHNIAKPVKKMKFFASAAPHSPVTSPCSVPKEIFKSIGQREPTPMTLISGISSPLTIFSSSRRKSVSTILH